MANKFLFLLFGLLLAASSCSNERTFQKSPLDELIRDMDKVKDFTIILYDMDVDGGFSSTYKHRYKIIREKEDGTPYEELTDWKEVSEAFFELHEQDMGMEIASKTDGVLTKQVAPPGYSKYVGNERYGSWQTDSSGGSFWQFYGQYMFMSSMLGLMAGPVYRNSYMDYRGGYYGQRPYYGPNVNGRPAYGTLSDASKQQNPNFHSRATSNTALKNRVNTIATRSTGGRASGSNVDRTTRSTSRYGTSSSSSSSSRSRSSSRGGK
jgi:hypothetical protein